MILLRFSAFIVVASTLGAIAGPLPEPVRASAYAPVNMDEALLGQLLFYDPILSGNKNIACATCHHPKFATSDGVALGIGEGGIGLGPARRGDPDNMPPDRIPRNSPALFNLGASEFTVMFHDGRIEVDDTTRSGFRTPLDDDMLDGFASLLSAQTMFPVLSPDEMAGQELENDVSKAVRQGLITGQGGAWDILARRVAALPDYAQRFLAVYDHIDSPDQIAFTDISNAISVFVAHEWRSDTSVFDAYLRDHETAYPVDAARGMTLFYGDAGCSNCHAGPFQTDHKFHPMGAPQLGPGKAAAFETHVHDLGRNRVTGDPADTFAFRTPSLRNVMQTGPWGHAGAHSKIDEFIGDHLDPRAAADRFSAESNARKTVQLPPIEFDDWREMDDPTARDRIIQAALVRAPVILNPSDIAALVAFLKTLDDDTALDGRMGIPDAVPSGLTVGGVAD
ncbi:cytochrome-c peroxidase [Sulfitobacter marinus]|nr:cytochrome c peroxidase [Sulfitobacter marinus]